MSYEINTIEEFCHRINAQGDQCNFKELMKSTSPSVFRVERSEFELQNSLPLTEPYVPY